MAITWNEDWKLVIEAMAKLALVDGYQCGLVRAEYGGDPPDVVTIAQLRTRINDRGTYFHLPLRHVIPASKHEPLICTLNNPQYGDEAMAYNHLMKSFVQLMPGARDLLDIGVPALWVVNNRITYAIIVRDDREGTRLCGINCNSINVDLDIHYSQEVEVRPLWYRQDKESDNG